jgi:ABC-type transport system involved in multi-copper enzyme maturation permease subunit
MKAMNDPQGPGTWTLWARQAGAIARFELKRFLLARRWVGIYIMALAPVALMYAHSRMPFRGGDLTANVSQGFAPLFQFFILEFGVFIACAVVFSQLFRGDILEKTLHFYLLTPARREVIAVGKYLAGVILVAGLFTISTAAAYLVGYSSSGVFASFFFEGPGFIHLARYLTVTVLATIAYGAVFLLMGLVFKNPGVPAFFLWGFESFSFALPSVLQRASIVHYLRPILPVHVDLGSFAILIDPVPPVAGIPILFLITAILLSGSGWFVRSTQVTYSAD